MPLVDPLVLSHDGGNYPTLIQMYRWWW